MSKHPIIKSTHKKQRQKFSSLDSTHRRNYEKGETHRKSIKKTGTHSHTYTPPFESNFFLSLSLTLWKSLHAHIHNEGDISQEKCEKAFKIPTIIQPRAHIHFSTGGENSPSNTALIACAPHRRWHAKNRLANIECPADDYIAAIAAVADNFISCKWKNMIAGENTESNAKTEKNTHNSNHET